MLGCDYSESNSTADGCWLYEFVTCLLLSTNLGSIPSAPQTWITWAQLGAGNLLQEELSAIVARFLFGTELKKTAYVGHFGPLTTCCAMPRPSSVKMSGRGWNRAEQEAILQFLSSFGPAQFSSGWISDGLGRGGLDERVVVGRSHGFWLLSLSLRAGRTGQFQNSNQVWDRFFVFELHLTLRQPWI